jgi:cardiolipin synthase
MEQTLTILDRAWHIVAGVLAIVLNVIASGHVVLHKRDSRSAVGWVGLIWLAPVAGAVAYALLGINRIRRRATEQRAIQPALVSGEFQRAPRLSGGVSLEHQPDHLAALGRLVDRVSGRALTQGNDIVPLINGDQAYPAMLAAIDGARSSITLGTYIFDRDGAGQTFAEALGRAAARGVEVRVLVDAVGSRYSRPPITRTLAGLGVRAALFGRTRVPWRMPYFNLRNHRKIVVVDGRLGFTGGMNVRQGNLDRPPHGLTIQDLHFALEGPVVAQLQQTFVEDWAFTTGEVLQGAQWFPDIIPAGDTVARVITDGPDGDFEKARLVYLGALGCAQESVRIVTPYFLPDAGLISALNVAALRGVMVEIVLPERSNLALVQWAATHQLWQLLQRGCRIYTTPQPFDHSKLMLVDDGWALIGSSNWDPRSLRLNWELLVDCYDRALVAQLSAIVEDKLSGARRLTKDAVDARPLHIKLRDGLARLAAPYL